MARARDDLKEISGLAPFGLRWTEATGGQVPFEAKGLGFLGPVPSATGEPMTELSTSFTIDGQQVAAPLLVPGLTDQELQMLQAGGEVPDSVYQKAYAHALMRLRQGQSPFASGQDLRQGYRDGGEVQPPQPGFLPAVQMAPGYLRRPEEARTRPQTSAEDLARLARQTGTIGLGFAPGAGMADYFGQFPSLSGEGTEPGAVENVQLGNYGTAALQLLGATGDMMYAVPLLGATVGSALKGPRALQKIIRNRQTESQRMLQELPKVDDLGFYSSIEKALIDNPQQRGTGDQFLAQIRKTPGVKPEELQYTGLEQFLAGRPSVTKAEIQDYLDANRVQVREVQVSDKPNMDRLRAIEDRNRLLDQTLEDAGYMVTNNPLFEDAGPVIINTRTNAVTGHFDLPPELRARLSAIQNRPIPAAPTETTRFSQWVLPGGTNYREVHLTLPRRRTREDVQGEIMDIELTDSLAESLGEIGGSEASSVFDNMMPPGTPSASAERLRALRAELSGMPEVTNYQVPRAHRAGIPEADINRLAHMRVNDRVVDGKNTLFIEEIQSDWHQAGRRQGYAQQIRPEQLTAQEVLPKPPGPRVWEVTYPDGTTSTFAGNSAEDAISFAVRREATVGVPDAPFKSTWDELTLKRALKMASDEGYDQIAFTTGRTQADRYKLSRQVDSIDVRSIDDNKRIVQINGKEGRPFQLQVDNDGVVTSSLRVRELEGRALDEVVGKDVAQQLMSATENRSITGLDLDVGGEGMMAFYDRMLPKKLEKIGKKYGVKPYKTTMDTPDGPVEIWAMDMPAEMREVIGEQGLPLFQIGAGAAGAGIMGLTGRDSEAAQ